MTQGVAVDTGHPGAWVRKPDCSRRHTRPVGSRCRKCDRTGGVSAAEEPARGLASGDRRKRTKALTAHREPLGSRLGVGTWAIWPGDRVREKRDRQNPTLGFPCREPCDPGQVHLVPG